MPVISIKGIDKARLLQALFNHSRQQGLGLLDEFGKAEMTYEHANNIITQHKNHPDRWPLSFDYLHGRVMKVDLSGDELDSTLYDRDNGKGAAEAVVAVIREDIAAEEDAAAMEEAEKEDGLNYAPTDPSPLDEVVDEPFDPLEDG